MDLKLRPAAATDAPAITAIYNHYIRETPITFDVGPVSVEERSEWLSGFAATGRYRLLVAERAGELVGYAGTLRFKPKTAYETSVEMTIYVRPDDTGRGIGPRLYQALFAAIEGEDVHRAYAGITLPNPASIRLHERFGFRCAGTFREVGRKLGRYWDVAWYERSL